MADACGLQAIAELDDLLNRAEAQQQRDLSVGSKDNEAVAVNANNAKVQQDGSDELFEVEPPGEVADETGPKEESAEAIEELLNARAVVVRESPLTSVLTCVCAQAEFQVVAVAGPEADVREPDLLLKHGSAARDAGSQDGEDIVEMEPPMNDELDEVRRLCMFS